MFFTFKLDSLIAYMGGTTRMGTSIQGKFWQLHLQEGMRVGGRVNCKRHPMGVGVIAGELEGKNWP